MMNKRTQLQSIENSQAGIQAAVDLIENSVRRVFIRSALLDKNLFDQPEVLDALSLFSRRSRFSEVHVLLDFPDRVLSMGHGLLEIQRRLTQKIIIKEYYDDKDEQIDSLLMNDNHALLIKPPGVEQAGFYSNNAAIECQQQIDLFEHAWLRSERAHHLRGLSL